MSALGFGELIAQLPHMMGYHPDPESLVIIGIRGNELAFTAVVTGDATQPRTHALRALCDQVGPAMERGGADAVAVIYYGNPDRLDAADAARIVLGGLRVPVHLFDVDEGHFRAGDALSGGWLLPRRLPPAPVVRHAVEPEAGGREAFYARLTPYPEARYPLLSDQDARSIDTLSPSLRVEIAQRALARLSAGAGDPGRWAILGHLVAGDADLALQLGHYAAGDQARVDSLIDTFRGAPVEHRAAIAAAAAAAAYLACRPSGVAATLLEHASPDSPLERLIVASVDAGVHPRAVYRELADTLPDDLETRDRQWEIGRHPAARTGAELV